jgi:predicted DNA-binding transcriptional regulator AlpA
VARQRLPQIPGLLAYEDVMELLSCSRPTVKRLVERGKIPPPHHIDHVGVRWFEDEIYGYLYSIRAERRVEKEKKSKAKTDAEQAK